MLHSRADAALQEHADAIARQMAITLSLETGGRPDRAELIQTRFRANDLRTWGRYLQILSPQGTIREKSDGLQTHPLPVSGDALRRGREGQVTFETFPALGEHPVRVVTVPVRLGPHIPFLVQAGTSLEGVEAALQRTSYVLGILTPSVFLLSLVGGWLLVGRALRRVDALTRTALEIQGSNLERRIHHSGPEDEIGRLARAFDQMIARLDRSFQQVRRFSADASHELKTPLTAIRGEAEVALLEPRAPGEYQRTLRSILESAERMSHIVESLLLLSRADAGQELIRREPVPLGELLLEVLERFESPARAADVRVEVQEIADVTVDGDPLWLTQIATNLLSNAVKYTPAGGQIVVSLHEAGATAELVVEDSGIGIPSEHLPRIFDRFYRVDQGRARTAGGAGLGLSITHWAVEAHGGTILVDSEVGKGSRFLVRLPLRHLWEKRVERSE